jgi:hypothetical protein
VACKARCQRDRMAGVEVFRVEAANLDMLAHYERSLKRWILPVAVLGSSGTYSTQRGYL